MAVRDLGLEGREALLLFDPMITVPAQHCNDEVHLSGHSFPECPGVLWPLFESTERILNLSSASLDHHRRFQHHLIGAIGRLQPFPRYRVVQPNRQPVSAGRRVGRERHRVPVGQVLAGEPAGGRVGAAARLAVTVASHDPRFIQQMHKDGVRPVGRGQRLPVQREIQRAARPHFG